jgi:hypothetical protein
LIENGINVYRKTGEQGGTMKMRFVKLALLSAVLFAAAPAFAQSVDDKIKSLEQELSQLKDQQIELKKEATAAAAAMPSFSYRPGNGLNIEAADKSWAFRATIESHFRYEFLSGRDQVGRSNGELMGRRFRPGFFYCIDNCLWEIEATLDLDGWGTGNAKNSTGTTVGSILQRGVVSFHGENINPWLPTATFGMDISTSGMPGLARQGSGATGAQAEYDLLSRNNGFNTGRAGSGMTLTWDDRSLSSIGIPGRIGRFQVGMASYGEGDDGLASFTDRKDFNTYISLQPMSELKNKWLRGLTFEYGAWFCNVDKRAAANGCSRVRIQDHGDGGRQTLFDTGADRIGKGLAVSQGPGLVYNVGPYTLRVMGTFSTAHDGSGSGTNTTTAVSIGHKSAHDFLIGHDLFLWSPKGFLTGSSSTTGSILAGTHFERTDVSCGSPGRRCNNGGTAVSINNGEFSRDRILLREWDLWYFVAPRMSVGINVLWYDASNLRRGTNQAAQNLGICNRAGATALTNCRSGIGGDWTDVLLNWRYTF